MTSEEKIDELAHVMKIFVQQQVKHDRIQREHMAGIAENITRLITMVAFLSAAVEKPGGRPAANDP